jgi:hypothetical protein
MAMDYLCRVPQDYGRKERTIYVPVHLSSSLRALVPVKPKVILSDNYFHSVTG